MRTKEQARDYNRRYQEKHRERLRLKSREYYLKNRQHAIQKQMEWKKRNLGRVAAYRRQNYLKHKTKQSAYNQAYIKRRRREDFGFRIRLALSSRFAAAIRSKAKKSQKTMEILGCSIRDFMIYLATKFEPGMSWDNYGTWEVDHIIPCALFDLTKPEHQKVCFHFSNLQPLWRRSNRSKSKRLSTSVQMNLL